MDYAERSVEERIERVTASLLPATAYNGVFGAPKSLKERLAHYHTPGISIAVVTDDRVEWERGFGLCEAGSEVPVTPATLFQAGSISKPIFALTVMRLVQEGRLDLDADVNTYLTSWKIPAVGDWQPHITLRQLLSHSAGLTVHGFPGYQTSEPIPTVVQVLSGEPPANTARVEVNLLPGIQGRYSGGGTTVAQLLVMDLLQERFPEIARRIIFEPLGLANSTYEQPLPSGWAVRAATAHPWKGIALNGKHHIYPEMAAAGLWTTAGDLARIGAELLRIYRGQPSPLLQREILEQMMRPQLSGQEVGDEFAGLGFFCSGKGESFYFGHGGWDEGFVAMMRMYPALGKGAVAMVNSNEGFPVLEEVLRAVAAEYGWPDVLPKDAAQLPISEPDRYNGVYTSKKGHQFRVSSRGNDLLFHYGPQPSLPLRPTAEAHRFATPLNTHVSFDVNESGSATALTIQQDGNQLQAERQQESTA